MNKLRTPRTNDAGISLIEVVVSMVILSIISAFIASFVAGSLQAISRAESTSMAATIAQEQIDRLLAVPIKEWGYEDADGKKLKSNLAPVEVTGKDGQPYIVTRSLSKADSDLNVKDACAATVGRRTSRADMIALKIAVQTKNPKYNDSYSTTTFIARDGNATFLKSSVTIKFVVRRGNKTVPYQEGRDGGPINVKVVDKYRGNDGSSEENKWSGNTQGGCITFLELDGKSPDISFDLDEYRMSDGKQKYAAKINMISGGHRELTFDISRTANVRIIPDVVGVPASSCDDPRLVRMRTPIAAPKNRALQDLGDIYRESQREVNRIKAISETSRSRADKAKLLSNEKWQYYLVCQGTNSPYRGNDFTHWFLLADTIPVSVIDDGEIRAVGRWSNSDFTPVSGKPGIEEGDWPVIQIDNPKVGGDNISIFPGSCLMSDNERRAQPYKLDKTFLNSAMYTPKNVFLPLWVVPLEGWYKATHPDSNMRGYLPLVIKGINDTTPTANMWGDSRIHSLNEGWYSGCKDTPVFDVGWLQDVDLNSNFAQMRMALPYGLYAYSIYGPDETQEVNGQTVTKSRNTCYPQKRSDRYAGERACIPAGARRVTFYQTDIRHVFRPTSWGTGENQYKDRFWDWLGADRGITYLPRGPILDSCEANTGDSRYCPLGKDAPSSFDAWAGPDDDNWRPGYRPGISVSSPPTSTPKPTPTSTSPKPPEPGYIASTERVAWVQDGYLCFKQESDGSYTNRCNPTLANQRTPYPNGYGRNRRPETSQEDSEYCWMRWGYQQSYNYCTDWYQYGN